MSFAVLAGIQSCAGGFNQTDSFTLILDDNFMQSIKSQASQRNAESDESVVTIAVTLSGEYSDSQSKTGTLSSLKNESFNFTQIPVRATFDLRVAIYRGKEIDELNLIYEGTQSGLTVAKGTKAVTVAMQKFLNTPIVLYEKNDDSTWTFFVDDASFDVKCQNQPEFTLDADGNLYLSVYDSQMQYYYKYSDGDLQPLTLVSTDTSNSVYGLFKTDYITNTLWLADYQMLYKLNISGNEFDTTNYHHMTTDLKFEENLYGFAINDNIAYFLFKMPDQTETFPYVLAKFDLTTAESSDENPDEFMFSIGENDLISLDSVNITASDYLSITDMLYQDGSIYILISDKYEKLSTDSSGALQGTLCNYGTVVKYDVFSGTVYNMSLENTTSSVKNLYIIGRADSGGDYRPFNQNYDGNDENTTYTPLIYDTTKYTDASITVCPQISEDISAKVLYSPKKFIAIKPKKLIIADDGIAYYVDSLGGLRYKNENHIVEVDLESFAISKVESASVNFNGDTEGDIVITSSVNFNCLFNGTYYVSDITKPSGYTQGPGGSYFAGIFSEE